MEGVHCAVWRHNIDIMGVTGTGLPGEDFVGVREALLAQLRRKGLVCIWGETTVVSQSRGVMIVYQRGLSISGLAWIKTESGCQLGVELMSQGPDGVAEARSCLLGLCRATRTSAGACVSDEAEGFDRAASGVVQRGLDEYAGRVLVYGDLDCSAGGEVDGMGLMHGTVVEGSLVCRMLGRGFSDPARGHDGVRVRIRRLLSRGTSIEETRDEVGGVLVPAMVYGLAASGVRPEPLTRSDAAVTVVEKLIGMDCTCTRLVVFASRKAGGMGMSSIAVEALRAAALKLGTVLRVADSAGSGLSLMEKMWQYMVVWGSYQYMRADESMVVAVYKLLGVYGIQVGV